jgi:hypothetical protein
LKYFKSPFLFLNFAKISLKILLLLHGISASIYYLVKKKESEMKEKEPLGNEEE